MTKLSIVLTDTAFAALSRRAQLKDMEIALYCSALLTELVEARPTQSIPPQEPSMGQDGKIKQMQLVKEIISYINRRGGKAPKPDVENALFERFKDEFQSSYYLELIGGGVPRWKKNVQFASDTAKKMGLMKPHGESGRGIWELTEKGHHWSFE